MFLYSINKMSQESNVRSHGFVYNKEGVLFQKKRETG